METTSDISLEQMEAAVRGLREQRDAAQAAYRDFNRQYDQALSTYLTAFIRPYMERQPLYIFRYRKYRRVTFVQATSRTQPYIVREVESGITRQVFRSELFGEDGAALDLPRLPIL